MPVITIILPFDSHPEYIDDDTAYQLEKFYGDLDSVGAESVTVFIDACFSGADRHDVDLVKGQRDLQFPDFSEMERPVPVLASCTSKQISFAYEDSQHGLFTYYLLLGLRGDADGADGSTKDRTITLRELEAFTQKQVSIKANELRNREQVPQLIGAKEKDLSRIIVQY